MFEKVDHFSNITWTNFHLTNTIYAMQISVEANVKTIKYIKAILNNWKKAGIKTLIEAQKENNKSTNAEEEFLNND